MFSVVFSIGKERNPQRLARPVLVQVHGADQELQTVLAGRESLDKSIVGLVANVILGLLLGSYHANLCVLQRSTLNEC